MKIFNRYFFAMVTLLLPLIAFAVTDKEMEQARTIATKLYLRYANNGSGYLDDVKVTTMADLEKALKAKEKENIVAFKAIKAPSDYKNWDKKKLVEFWSVTAFETKGLLEKGKEAKPRVKKQLEAMTIAPPVKEEPAKAEEPAKQPETSSAQAPVAETASTSGVTSESPDSAAMAAEKALLEQLEAEEELQQVKKEESHTWVYILCLALIVGVVLALVVFASNIFKKSGSVRSSNYEGAREDDGEREEELKRIIDDKNSEINMLSKKLEGARRQNDELKQKLEALATEVSSLRNRLSETKRDDSHHSPHHQQHHDSQRQREEKPIENQPQRQAVKTLYLGRANSKGIFVRADRNLVAGASVYKLETPDGISGVFRVANSPEVWSMALKLPKEYLGFACIGPDFEDTAGMTQIVNDSPGSAVFEGGCWRVIRKARIHFE